MKPGVILTSLSRVLAAAGLVLILLAVALWITKQKSVDSTQSASATQVEDKANSSAQAPKLAPAPEVDPRKQLATSAFNELLIEGLNPEQQTEIIGNLLIDYWITHRSLPTGTQEEVYESLSGKNRKGIVYAPREHPSFTPNGFQAKGDEASVVLHVRSSREGTFDLIHTGPDQLVFTEDDQVRAFRHGS